MESPTTITTAEGDEQVRETDSFVVIDGRKFVVIDGRKFVVIDGRKHFVYNPARETNGDEIGHAAVVE